MVFDKIEALKKSWTDKYVVVDASHPELRRFGGQTGKVKTVNMSGRALVEFDANANIGWFDIDLSFLKQIDAPLPKAEKPKAEAKAKAGPTPSTVKPAEAGATKPAPAAGGAGKNIADILAAARGSKPTPAVAVNEPPAKPTAMSTADILAAARAKAGSAPKAEAKPAVEAKPAAPTAKADPGKMSTADILAAARGKKEAAAAAPAPTAKTAPVAKPTPPPTPEPELAAEEPAADGAIGSKKDAFKTVAEMVAYCRKVDTH